jgi:hypothetical protein
MPPSERREMYIAQRLEAATELLVTWAIAAGADSITIDRREELKESVQRMLNDAWANGAHNEADLRSARDGERLLRQRMESILRRHGLPVPTAPLPSEPPPPPTDDD